jgi:hypothetical protein
VHWKHTADVDTCCCFVTLTCCKETLQVCCCRFRSYSYVKLILELKTAISERLGSR